MVPPTYRIVLDTPAHQRQHPAPLQERERRQRVILMIDRTPFSNRDDKS
jgi:hypothetical protein